MAWFSLARTNIHAAQDGALTVGHPPDGTHGNVVEPYLEVRASHVIRVQCEECKHVLGTVGGHQLPVSLERRGQRVRVGDDGGVVVMEEEQDGGEEQTTSLHSGEPPWYVRVGRGSVD